MSRSLLLICLTAAPASADAQLHRTIGATVSADPDVGAVFGPGAAITITGTREWTFGFRLGAWTYSYDVFDDNPQRAYDVYRHRMFRIGRGALEVVSSLAISPLFDPLSLHGDYTADDTVVMGSLGIGYRLNL